MKPAVGFKGKIINIKYAALGMRQSQRIQAPACLADLSADVSHIRSTATPKRAVGFWAHSVWLNG